jgi:hypothetical protein
MVVSAQTQTGLLCVPCVTLLVAELVLDVYSKVVQNLLRFPKISEPYLLDMWNSTYSGLK